MLATLLFTVVAYEQQQPNLFRTIIKQPTGRNGYEEYIQAADIADRINLREIVAQVNAEKREGRKLDAQRDVASRMDQVLVLIRRGNSKPVSYPNQIDFDTRLPELSYFRLIADAMVHTAEVRLAEGQPNVAQEILTDVVVFGDTVAGSGPVIFNLVGRLVSSRGLQATGKYIRYVSVPAAQKMTVTCTGLLERQSPFLNSLRWEFDAILRGLDQFLETPGMFVSSESVQQLTDYIESASANEVAEAKRQLIFALEQQFNARVNLLNSPESQWVEAAREIDELTTPTGTLAKVMFESLMPALGRIDLYATGRRTQLRLLRAHAAVMDYRWNNGFYPASLDSIEDRALVFDPLSEQQFEYERTADNFTLYSRGTEETGRIDLFYIPPRSAAVKPD